MRGAEIQNARFTEMKFVEKASDGGTDSGVTGYFLFEIKPLFSIVLLHFRKGTREAYHSHAFNAITLWLRGRVIEHRLRCNEYGDIYKQSTQYRPGQLKYTGRTNMHKVQSLGDSYALSIRGPWAKTWKEFKAGKIVTLTNGRKVVSEN
jgi:hypothetical protein